MAKTNVDVVVRNGNIDSALLKFKQKLSKNGTPSEFRKHESYTKPGVRRKEAKEAGIRNARNRARKSNSDYRR